LTSSSPGSGSPANQLHDYNGGIQPSGLFWVVELPRDAFRVSDDGQRATLDATNVCMVNSFQFLGPNNVAAIVSLPCRWQATGPAVRRGRGSEVPPTDPAAFLGRIAPARSTGSFSGSHVGFSFIAWSLHGRSPVGSERPRLDAPSEEWSGRAGGALRAG
jgi:hypothetical protein